MPSHRSCDHLPALRRSRGPWLSLASLTALLAAVAPTAGSGQGGQPSPQLSGTWQLQGSVEQARQAVQQAVDPAVASMTPDMQRMARARIAETTWVPQRIRIAASPAQISVQFTGSESRSFDTVPGQPQNVYSRSGVRAQMIQTFRPDGSIQQQFQAMDGTQHNILSANGGQLHLDVLMQSQRLDREIRFRLTYRRAG